MFCAGIFLGFWGRYMVALKMPPRAGIGLVRPLLLPDSVCCSKRVLSHRVWGDRPVICSSPFLYSLPPLLLVSQQCHHGFILLCLGKSAG